MNSKNKRVLILGASGMLGAMVFEYLNKLQKYSLGVTFNRNEIKFIKQNSNYATQLDAREIKSEELRFILNEFQPDYIINCIGIINKYCDRSNFLEFTTALKVNSIFPHLLNDVINSMTINPLVIQIATDCVFNGKQGSYNEHSLHDDMHLYGISKSLGEVKSENFLNVRCSIIGPEVFSRLSLFEWVKSQKTFVNGYTNHLWNGVTTLDFSAYCDKIISNSLNRNLPRTHHLVMHDSISKYSLVGLINEIFNLQLEVVPTQTPVPVNRTLDTVFSFIEIKTYRASLNELRAFIQNSKIFTE
jgi:dTDP-4-dehydrorhamnose reductase